MAAKEKPTASAAAAPEGDRIAKVLSRRGIASRREAERLIEAGEVKVNGKTITSPALNVTAADRITVSGEALPDEEPARLWLYYKPDGLVTSNADEKGRETVFDRLPEDLPRVMSVGRLDLNSEGLLLLTNDGALKRRLELPSTGWLRKYRVRVNGNPTDPDLEPLRKGITVEGERFQPMQVVLDRIQGANAWLTVGLREGKNREIRRAMAAINLTVNRLIRVSYGPFRLGEMQPGQVEEVRQKVLRDQLGEIDRAEGGAGGDGKPAAAKARTRAPRRSPASGALPPGDAPRPLAAARSTPPGTKPGPTPRSADTPRPARSADSPSRAARPAAPGAKPRSTSARDSDTPNRPAPGAKSRSADSPRPARSADNPSRAARPAATGAKPAAAKPTGRAPAGKPGPRNPSGGKPPRRG